LRRFREVALDAYANQEVPFDKIREKQHAKRSLSHGALFQVLFVLHQGTSQQDLSLSGLAVERVPVEMGAVKFALIGFYGRQAGGSQLRHHISNRPVRRRNDPTPRRTVPAALVRHCRGSESAVSRLPLMAEVERHQMLVAWNETSKDHPSDRCIHELFEQQVSRTPDACAVVAESAALSYRELNDKAAAVADRLRQAGARAGTCVVI
jgi:non-ribosomal peptide synthetase component F